MTKQKTPKEAITPVNLKEQNACHTFTLTFRDREHFYRVVKWMNDAAGKGKDKWTTQGRVLKPLTSTGKPVTTKIYVFVESFDPQSSLYLSLV